jgi:hypothetical protein
LWTPDAREAIGEISTQSPVSSVGHLHLILSAIRFVSAKPPTRRTNQQKDLS